MPNQSNRQSRIKIKDPSGHEVDFRDLVNKQGTSGASTPGTGPGSSAPSPVSIEKQQNRRQPVRLESEEARQKRVRDEEERKKKEKEEEDMKRKQKEEAERKQKEELERKKKEEEELRLKKEEEEKRRKEDERRQKEEEERIAREEKERKEREEQERLRKEEEEKERIRKEEEEKDRRRKEEEEKERIRKEEEEKERLRREEEERAIAKAKEEDEKANADSSKSEPQAIPIPVATTKPDITPLSISPESHKRRPIPGPLDLSSANKPGLPQPLPSALATARHIQDLYQVSYPDHIKSPKPELNANAKDGKFRYVLRFSSSLYIKTTLADSTYLADMTEISSFSSCRSVKRNQIIFLPLKPLASSPLTNLIRLSVVAQGGAIGYREPWVLLPLMFRVKGP